jgi:hypothetical protein
LPSGAQLVDDAGTMNNTEAGTAHDMSDSAVLISLISALGSVAAVLVAVAAWVRSGKANAIAREVLDAQTATRIKVRCRRGVDPDLPGPVTVVLAVAENVGGLTVEIERAFIMWYHRDGKQKGGHSFLHAVESETGKRFSFPELPQPLKPREILRVPIPEEWFQRDLELQMQGDPELREFTFRFQDTMGVYYESPRMSIKCHWDDCPRWAPVENQARSHLWSLDSMRRRWRRFQQCR